MYDTLRFDPDAERSVEPMGGAFVWSDEHPGLNYDDRAIPILKFLQYLVWYRKSLIENEPFEPFTTYWNLFKSECPTWPGFRPERCDPMLLQELKSETEIVHKRLERVIGICNRKQNREDSTG
jgi:hypothetical protein